MSEDERLLLVFCGAVPGLATRAESICVRPRRGGRSSPRFRRESDQRFLTDERWIAEPVGGANGDEPFGPVSISASLAAHPRRSPLSLDPYAIHRATTRGFRSHRKKDSRTRCCQI